MFAVGRSDELTQDEGRNCHEDNEEDDEVKKIFIWGEHCVTGVAS